MKIRIKRVYDPPEKGDGTRVLVDRLWPRGLTKERAKIDVWLKDIAPSAALRKWFSHEATKWPEFQDRYAQELLRNSSLVEQLRDMAKKGAVTLVYAAKDEAHNEAILLQRWLGTS